MPDKHSCSSLSNAALISATPGRLVDSGKPWQALRLLARGSQTRKGAAYFYHDLKSHDGYTEQRAC